MRFKSYIPEAKSLVELFRPKQISHPIVEKQQTIIELTSPIRSVVDRAKSELERISKSETPKRLISSSDSREERSQGKRTSTRKKLATRKKFSLNKPLQEDIKLQRQKSKTITRKLKKNSQTLNKKTHNSKKVYFDDIFV